MRSSEPSDLASAQTFSLAARVRAWSVHTFTASGAALGAWALVAMHQGDLRSAAIAMMVAFAIDAADGSLARAFRVSKVIPWFDGRRLDDMVDYLNYVVVAVLFLLAAGGLPNAWWLAPPIMASAYGFSNEDAKTDDDFFLGFPSYWNVVALYVWLLGISASTGAALVAALSVGVFIPFKYLYPTKMTVFRRSMIVGGLAWYAVLFACVLWRDALAPWHVAELSLVYPAIYFALSFKLGGWHRPR